MYVFAHSNEVHEFKSLYKRIYVSMYVYHINVMFFGFIRYAEILTTTTTKKNSHPKKYSADCVNERISLGFGFANESDAGLENVLNLWNQLN